MPELLKRDCSVSIAHSMVPSAAGIPWWNSTSSQMQHSSFSRNLSFKMATPPKPCKLGNQLDFQLHDQDSSSTQSTGQSYPEVACVGESKNCGKSLIPKESGCPGTDRKPNGHTKSTLSSRDYTSLPSQVDYRQTFGTTPFTYPDTYYHGFFAAYEPHPTVHPQMMLITPSRVPLPHDLPQDEPIYVNAKQYRAILRRREYRAKLEAQNKLSKVRKPYLHESRHRHALNRARGPGGRFLTQKKLQEFNGTKSDGQDNSGSGNSQLTSKMWESEVCLLQNFKEGDPTTSSSDITSVSNVNNIFHRQEFGFSLYPPHVGGPTKPGGGGITGGTPRYLSVPR